MKRRAWLGLILLPAVLLLAGWGWWSGIRVAREARQELALLEARRRHLEAETRTLRREVELLRLEKWARERAAREMLPVVGEDEILVVVPRPSQPAGAASGGGGI